MEHPFFTNRRYHQQPDPSRHPLSHLPAPRRVPVYHAEPARDAHPAVNSVQRSPESKSGPKIVRIPVRFVGSEQVDRFGSALKIQKVFRGFLVRKCLKKIKEIKVQVDEIEERLSKSEIVELVLRDEKERLRMNESLMSMLFKLDSICGVDFGVRGCRKAVTRKVIALQEKIDAIVAFDLERNDETADREPEVRVTLETDSSSKSDHHVNQTEGYKSLEIEGDDREDEIIDVGVDCEVKVSEANVANSGDVCENLNLVAEDGVKETFSGEDEKDKSGGATIDGDDNKRNRELMERMMEDNEKMMSLMTQLSERNETQMKMLKALTHRVELLEKAFVCDRLRTKKKTTKSAAACREN